MSEVSAIEAATKRLTLALEALEAAVEHRENADSDQETLAAQLHALGTDRSQLACDLDAAVSHSHSLENTNREIARRLDAAIESIRSVLETNDR
jgi:hypothetical protein